MTTAPRVQIIDYHLGNLFSIQQACHRAGLDAFVSSSPLTISDVAGVILPGVGAFGNAMDNLQRLQLLQPLQEYAAAGRPLFGICLGMQLLFEDSEEFGLHAGLGLLRGHVRRLPVQFSGDRRLRVPHVGWQQTWFAESAADQPVRAGIPDGQHMYYVHSYFAEPQDSADILTFTQYGQIRYCSAVLRGNIFGVQFHPERSARAGLRFYENWGKVISRTHADCPAIL